MSTQGSNTNRLKFVRQKDNSYVFSEELFQLDENLISVVKNVYTAPTLTHYHDFYEIQYVYSGRVVQYINGVKYEMPKGTLTVFNKNVVHSIEAGTSQDRLYHIGISEKILDHNFFASVSKNNPVTEYLYQALDGQDETNDFIKIQCNEPVIETMIRMMEEEYLTRTKGFQKNCKLYLGLLINKLFQLTLEKELNGDKDTYGERIRMIRSLMNEHYKSITLNELAEKIHVHPNYLSKFMSKHMGISFNRLLTEIRMDKASYLLIATNLSIENISDEIGFKNVNYFYKLFKNKYNMTPKAYRKKERS